MAQLHINVTEDAVRTLDQLSARLYNLNDNMAQQLRALRGVFADNAPGLGPHCHQIELLLEELESLSQAAALQNRKLAQKASRAAAVRRGLLDSSPYPQVKDLPDDAYIPEVLGRIYDDLVRQRIRPRELGTNKEVRGAWKDQVFYANDDFVPRQHNPDKLTFGEIRQELSRDYGITFDGIRYENGYADFSPVAVARLDIHEIVAGRQAADAAVSLDTVFADREVNFRLADQLTAEKQISIPGLAPGYTAGELAQWRQKKQFSWEESYTNGYLLVPSIVHGNLSHTGLVAVSTHGTDAEKAFAKRHGGK